jgi:ribonuclease-3
LETKNLNNLNKILGSPFSDHHNLKLALTHRSASPRNFERLEFLGDSILSFVIADSLYRKFPTAREGQLSRLRARLVKRETLAELAREFGLGEYLILGSGEQKSGGYKRDSILSDAFEAVIGAIYLEKGLDVVRERLEHWFHNRIESLSPDDTQKDSKTRLQEFLQSRGSELPIYAVVSVEGRAHDQEFNVECRTDALKQPTLGSAGSRRQAEQIAAGAALELLGIVDD